MEDKVIRQFMIDAYGYLHYCLDNNCLDTIGRTLIHDISGIVQEQKCFSAYVSGYAKYLKSADKIRLGVPTS